MPVVDQANVHVVAAPHDRAVLLELVHLADVRAGEDDQVGGLLAARRLGAGAGAIRVVSSSGLATRSRVIVGSLPTGDGFCANTMRLLVGTSGFCYPAWRGGFYPEKLPDGEDAGVLRRALRGGRDQQHLLPDARTGGAAAWAAETPDGFRFALKSPRRITHEKKLADVARSRRAAAPRRPRALGEKLGPVLFQLPPNMKKDLPRLRRFPGRPAAGHARRRSSSGTSRGSPTTSTTRLRARKARAVHRRGRGAARRRSRRPPAGGTCGCGARTTTDAALARWAERMRGQGRGRPPTSSSSTRTRAKGPELRRRASRRAGLRIGEAS